MLSRRWLLCVAGAASSAFAASYVVPPDEILIRKAQGIVIARATTSWVEESAERGIETVTEFAVEDSLKGFVPLTFRIRIPGGKFGERIKMLPGAPRFVDGEDALLFINKRPGTDDYITTDFALGDFSFAYDDRGRHLAVRENEIFGWDLGTNLPHQEPRRDADQFIAFIKAIVAGEKEPPGYFVPKRPLLGKTTNANSVKRPVPLACAFPACSATSYMLASLPPDENSQGLRWNVFPTAVNWNRGNSEPGASNNGADAISAAFNSWNGDTSSIVNYALTTANSNINGITEAPDSVNNVVFEHNFGSDYVCGGGGLLGVGGIQSATGTHMSNGETFSSTVEVDVSMNKGIANCTSLFNSGDFNSAVTHEVGHTLGIRHMDKNRSDNDTCASNTNLECGSSGIMTAVVTMGISAALQTWDQNAVRTIYPGGSAPAAVAGVVATTTTSTNIQVSWTGSCSMTCHIYRSTDHITYTQVGTMASSPFNDTVSATPDAYLYKVRAFNGTESPDSNIDLAVNQIYTTDPLVAMTTQIMAVHLTQLRAAADLVRGLAGLGGGAYTDGSPAGVVVKAVHITEIRTQLDAAMAILGLTTGGYTDGSLGGVVVKAAHFQELRTRMK
jgi:hypothetical protein